MFQPRMCPTVIATAFAAFIVFAANDADAAQAQQLHESRVIEQIESYCVTSWRNAKIPRAEWSDCSQEVFADLLERVSRKRLSKAILDCDSLERRQLNRAIWRATKRWLRRVRHVSLGGSDCPDPTTTVRSYLEEEVAKLDAVRRAAEQLTPRQQRILCWSFDGQSIGSISERLGIPPARVSDEKYRAIQKIRRNVTTS